MKRYNSFFDPRSDHRHKQKKPTKELLYKVCDTLRGYQGISNAPLMKLCREIEDCGIKVDRSRAAEPNYLYNLVRDALYSDREEN